MEKAYFDNIVKCPVALTHVSGAGANSVVWRSDSVGEVESGPSASNGRTVGKTPRHRGGGRIRGRR